MAIDEFDSIVFVDQFQRTIHEFGHGRNDAILSAVAIGFQTTTASVDFGDDPIGAAFVAGHRIETALVIMSNEFAAGRFAS